MARWDFINNQMQRLRFSTLSIQKEDVDAHIFSNLLTASLGPVNYRPVFGDDEALLENVVGKMAQRIKMMFGQFDALDGRWAR
jgi:TfoX/Sxy family transcriptional regulator of competence genes